VIIAEFIGYLVETAAIALWRTKPVQSFRNWWAADEDRGVSIFILGLAIFWVGLFIHGLA
jgi:hypothetical protein